MRAEAISGNRIQEDNIHLWKKIPQLHGKSREGGAGGFCLWLAGTGHRTDMSLCWLHLSFMRMLGPFPPSGGLWKPIYKERC
jgi:hypothetical protein